MMLISLESNVQFTTVNYPRVLSDPDLSCVVKNTARQLMESSYMTLKDFFTSLSDSDIVQLMDMVDNAENNSTYLKNLLLLSEMLARAEGTDELDDEASYKNLNYFCALITCISLERKGLVKVKHENMTFGDDIGDLEVVRIVND